ncbi:MAG: phosphoglycerate kinase [Cyclobacteriaceae bacterium]|nr:phosphoglycerate kinase [Cyclobacteriaceae bacterium]
MKTVDSYNFSGKKAVVRVDFNVPLNEKYEVTDDTRIRAAMPTIKKILKDGGTAILMSHLGRPKGGYEEKFSLKHILPVLNSHLGKEVKFADDCLGESAKKMITELKAGEVLLLENLRFYKEEEGKAKTEGLSEEDAKAKKGEMKENQKKMAKQLASYGDVWVNDAFGTAHRAHASTAVIAQFVKEKICGYLIHTELENAQKVLDKPRRPFTAIMGGAKVSDKILIIERLLDKVDNLIIGGGMSYTFSKALGGTIGKSLLEEDKQQLTLDLIKKANDHDVKLILPVDTVIADDFKNEANKKVVKAGEIPDGWMGLDIGPETIKLFAEVIENSKTILWNGPMGVFEFENFEKGTVEIAEAVVKATNDGGFSLIGGGDSASAINNLGYGEKVSHVSTGGGALLEYMEGKTLPGIAVLEE